MHSLHPACLLLLFLLVGTAALSAGETVDRDEAATRARNIVADGSYQKEIAAPPRLKPSTDRRTGEGQGLGTLSLILIVLASMLAVSFAIVWLVGTVNNRARIRDVQAADRAGAAGQEENRKEINELSLENAERLAAEGRYLEAVHHLLLLAVKRQSFHAKKPVTDDMTSRELAALLPRSQNDRVRFRYLVKTVELSLFGGRSPGQKEFRNCLDAFKGIT